MAGNANSGRRPRPVEENLRQALLKGSDPALVESAMKKAWERAAETGDLRPIGPGLDKLLASLKSVEDATEKEPTKASAVLRGLMGMSPSGNDAASVTAEEVAEARAEWQKGRPKPDA